MKRNQPIRSIMSTDIASVNVTEKLSDVRAMISERGIHHVPVVSGTKLVGLISATDMVRVSFSAYGADQRAVDAVLDHDFTIEKVMTTEVETLAAKSTVREAAQRLSPGSFHSLPVVDEDNNLVGMVTSTDLIRYLVAQY